MASTLQLYIFLIEKIKIASQLAGVEKCDGGFDVAARRDEGLDGARVRVAKRLEQGDVPVKHVAAVFRVHRDPLGHARGARRRRDGARRGHREGVDVAHRPRVPLLLRLEIVDPIGVPAAKDPIVETVAVAVGAGRDGHVRGDVPGERCERAGLLQPRHEPGRRIEEQRHGPKRREVATEQAPKMALPRDIGQDQRDQNQRAPRVQQRDQGSTVFFFFFLVGGKVK
jgi:hypothetical protein